MTPISLYIDADACPVKQEIYRVGERQALKGTALKVFVVSNSPIAVPRDDMIERVVVGAGKSLRPSRRPFAAPSQRIIRRRDMSSGLTTPARARGGFVKRM